MNASPGKRVFLLGYGNPGRRDDGLGPALASAIEALNLPEVAVEAAYQLNIEDAATLAAYDRALFVDASIQSAAPYELRKATAAPAIAFTSHSVSPDSVLAICEEHFNPAPEAWVLAIRGYDFELGEGLSPQAGQNLEHALAFARTLLDEWRT